MVLGCGPPFFFLLLRAPSPALAPASNGTSAPIAAGAGPRCQSPGTQGGRQGCRGGASSRLKRSRYPCRHAHSLGGAFRVKVFGSCLVAWVQARVRRTPAKVDGSPRLRLVLSRRSCRKSKSWETRESFRKKARCRFLQTRSVVIAVLSSTSCKTEVRNGGRPEMLHSFAAQPCRHAGSMSYVLVISHMLYVRTWYQDSTDPAPVLPLAMRAQPLGP